MKGKRKAAASPNMALTDVLEDAHNMVEVLVQSGNAAEDKERDGLSDNFENREGEGEGEEEEDEGDDDDNEDEEEKGEEERPKLDEGFFEIEAIRRKRVRKVSLFFPLTHTLVCLCFNDVPFFFT